ncbi:MAG: hydrolase, HAD-superfamily, subfamily [Arthrobacter sp.]|nr:hydrolase, HAD-superfamily, subfamily [Arthrobacter sp.]
MGSFSAARLKAVLFDRDGTLVRDVPFNGNPELVEPMPQAGTVLLRLRRRGIATGVLTNQSGVSRGLLAWSQVADVNRRIEERLGPFDVWEICPHGPDDGCSCRKPEPGMIVNACRRLGISPGEAAYIGDIGSDMEAAEAAGARGILVPTPLTRAIEVSASREVAPDLSSAVALLIGSPAAGDRP